MNKYLMNIIYLQMTIRRRKHYKKRKYTYRTIGGNTNNMFPSSWTSVKHVYYINLDHREDRLKEIHEQLEIMGISNVAERFSAIKIASKGALGCSLSHYLILQNAVKLKLPYVIILEDDIVFTKPAEFISQFNTFAKSNLAKKVDVLLFGASTYPPYQSFPEAACIKISVATTTTGYMVMQHYFNTLLRNFHDGICQFMINYNTKQFAIDEYWKRLHKAGNWYMLDPLTVVQRESYSDIRHATYDTSIRMLDKDASWWKPENERDEEYYKKYEPWRFLTKKTT